MTMTKEEKAAATQQDMIEFGAVLRGGNEARIRAAFAIATTQPAVSMERYKETTLAAAFIFEYAAIVAKRPRYNDKIKKLFAELVLNEAGVTTLHRLNWDLKGSPQRFIELFAPFTDLSDEQLADVLHKATTK